MDFNKIFLQNDISQFDTPQFNNKIDIYVKQRNGKKCITMIEGLPEDKDKLKAYAKDLRKKLGCSCSVISEKDGLHLVPCGVCSSIFSTYDFDCAIRCMTIFE